MPTKDYAALGLAAEKFLTERDSMDAAWEKFKNGSGSGSALKLLRKLTLPVDKTGKLSGSALEIMPDKLDTYTSEWYFKEGNYQIFVVPPVGATTDNASYPRTEYRYFKEGADGEMVNFKRGVDVWEKTLNYTIRELNKSGKLVIAQSHAVEAPPDYKVVADGGGGLRVLCKLTDTSDTDDLILDLTEGKKFPIKVGTEFSLKIWFDGYTLKISLNGGAVQTASFATKKTDWYPKDGAYNAARYKAVLAQRLA